MVPHDGAPLLDVRAPREARPRVARLPPVARHAHGGDEPEEHVGQVDPHGAPHALDAAVAFGILVDVHLPTGGLQIPYVSHPSFFGGVLLFFLHATPGNKGGKGREYAMEGWVSLRGKENNALSEGGYGKGRVRVAVAAEAVEEVLGNVTHRSKDAKDCYPEDKQDSVPAGDEDGADAQNERHEVHHTRKCGQGSYHDGEYLNEGDTTSAWAPSSFLEAVFARIFFFRKQCEWYSYPFGVGALVFLHGS